MGHKSNLDKFKKIEIFPGIFSDHNALRLDLNYGSEVKTSACNVGDLGSIPGSEDPLEKGMATHSGILAWRIPWTEEPGGLPSTGLQRVGHD